MEQNDYEKAKFIARAHLLSIPTELYTQGWAGEVIPTAVLLELQERISTAIIAVFSQDQEGLQAEIEGAYGKITTADEEQWPIVNVAVAWFFYKTILKLNELTLDTGWSYVKNDNPLAQFSVSETIRAYEVTREELGYLSFMERNKMGS